MILIQEIKNRFFEKTGDLEKREMEKENVSSLESGQDFQFLTLCDILVSSDVVGYILGFMKYDFELINSVGRISKFFYITILSSWRQVTIRKKNVYEISLLVLRSVRSVIFEVHPNQPATFINSELEHILKNLNPDRLREIHINARVYSFTKILRFFCRRKEKSVFQNVRKLRFNTGQQITPAHTLDEEDKVFRKKDFDSYKKKSWKGLVLKKSFPSLKEADSILNFDILEGLFLKKLSIDLSLPYSYDLYAMTKNKVNVGDYRSYRRSMKKRKLEEKVTEITGLLGESKRDKGLNKESVEHLEIKFHNEDVTSLSQSIPKFLHGFTNLRLLRLSMSKMYVTSASDLHQFSLSSLSCVSKSLTELHLNDDFPKSWLEKSSKELPDNPNSGWWKYSQSAGESVGISFILPKLRKLSVYSPTMMNPVAIYFLSSKGVKELDIPMFLDNTKASQHQIPFIMERISQRFFEFEKITLRVKIKVPKQFRRIKTVMGGIMGGYREDTYILYVSYNRQFLRYGTNKPACCIRLFSGDEPQEKGKWKELSKFPFLHTFLSEFPATLASNKIPVRIHDYLITMFREEEEEFIAMFDKKMGEEGNCGKVRKINVVHVKKKEARNEGSLFGFGGFGRLTRLLMEEYNSFDRLENKEVIWKKERAMKNKLVSHTIFSYGWK